MSGRLSLPDFVVAVCHNSDSRKSHLLQAIRAEEEQSVKSSVFLVVDFESGDFVVPFFLIPFLVKYR